VLCLSGNSVELQAVKVITAVISWFYEASFVAQLMALLLYVLYDYVAFMSLFSEFCVRFQFSLYPRTWLVSARSS